MFCVVNAITNNEHIGNFKTREEATAMLNDMRKTFPAFGREMYVVIDEVKIPLEQLQEQ